MDIPGHHSNDRGYQAHLDPIWRLKPAQQTTIFRLRTGHCGLSAHRKRTGLSDTSLCECRQADESPVHVLQSCPIYTERRQLTRPRGADLATKLWGPAEDLYQTAGFVASTGLKIWPARLSITEQEEEELTAWRREKRRKKEVTTILWGQEWLVINQLQYWYSFKSIQEDC